nr:RdgB/HAM1 family non-canonical purine NTP pyrophosphatase [Clostridia bacterium]
MNIIIASNNKGKIKEFKKILEPLGYNVFSQSETGVNIEVEETGTTFEENAKLKARAIYNLKHTAVLADDSGIVVDYLNGEPGIYSARYMGLQTDEERRRCVLYKMKDAKKEDRTARYVCCICYIEENGKENIVNGIWEGIVADKEYGENGFGYDPIFMPNGSDKTVAQMLPEEKNTISHRAMAIQKLKELLS